MENMKDDLFSYIDFSSARSRDCHSLNTIFKIKEKADGSKAQPVYRVVFSEEISVETKKNGCSYLRIRTNSLTNEMYFVFETERRADSLNAFTNGGNGKKICVSNKGLVEHIMKLLEIKDGNRVRCDIDISPNKSKVEGVLVYQLLGIKR